MTNQLTNHPTNFLGEELLVNRSPELDAVVIAINAQARANNIILYI